MSIPFSFRRMAACCLAVAALGPMVIAQTSGSVGDLPTVTLRATDTTASESNSNAGVFQIVRSGDTTADLTVYYRVNGTASNGVDYAPLSGLAFVPAGATGAVVVVDPVDDAQPENAETVILTLQSNDAYRVVSPYAAYLLIQDNDNQPPSVAITAPVGGSVFTAPASVAVEAAASDPDGQVTRVEFSSEARALGTDTSTPYSVLWTNIPPGFYAVSAKAWDSLGLYRVSAPVRFAVYHESGLPLVRVAAADAQAAEPGSNTGAFHIYRIGDTNGSLTVRYATGGTASNGTDYARLGGEATIPAGAVYTAVGVAPLNDWVAEGTETVSLAIAPDPGYVIGENPTATVFIADDDLVSNDLPTVRLIAPTNGAVFFGLTNIALEAEAADSDGAVVRVEFVGDSLGVGTDTNAPFAVTWLHANVGTHVLKAKAVDDRGAYAWSASVTVTVQQVPALPLVKIIAADSAAAEPGTNTGLFRVYRYGDTNVALDVRYSIGGTASNGADYAAVSGLATFPVGAAYAHVPIEPIDDTLIEGAESVVLTIVSNAAYAVVYPPAATVWIEDNDRPTNAPPSVALVSPTNGSVFTVPATVQMEAVAGDSDGRVIRVEFYRNDAVVGYDTNPPFASAWVNPPAGAYALRAKAVDDKSAFAWSAPVAITVVQPPALPVVRVAVGDGYASETGSNQGLFQIMRTGGTNDPLDVRYALGGTAADGSDYAPLSGSATIPAGVLSVPVAVVPVDDALVEGNETVILTLVTNAAYALGVPAYGQVTIEDNDRPSNASPWAVVTAPTNGTVFPNPTSIVVEADAGDPDGRVTRVEFWANDRVVGVATSAPYAAVWVNAPAGYHTVRARAVDNLGASAYSAPVRVVVLGATYRSYARRTLPRWYVPGVKVVVGIRAEIVPPTQQYVVEDHPPVGWTVGPVSGGTCDSGAGVVRFGPFSDQQARTFLYEVVPPADQTGEGRFGGALIADGAPSPILGAQSVVAAPPHPADNAPADFVLRFDELAAYATAWTNGGKFPVAPNPIPANYVARAGCLWMNGEWYWLSTNYPTPYPPMLWVNGGAPAPPPSPNSVGAAWGWPGLGTAVSDMPTNFTPGVPFRVTLSVVPSNVVCAYVVQDRAPEGWRVGSISDGGVYCPLTRTVKWPLFLDNAPRVLGYDVTPPASAGPVGRFSGIVSFDGWNVPILGRRETRLVPAPGPSRLASLAADADPARDPALVSFPAEPGVYYLIEASTDLFDWVPVEELLSSGDTLEFIDPDGPAYGARFYRAVPEF